MDGLIWGGVGGGVEEGSFGGVDEGIAATEDGQRGEGVEAGGGSTEAVLLQGQGLRGDTLEAQIGGGEAMPGVGEAEGDVLAAKAVGEESEAVGGDAGAAGDGGSETEVEFVEMLVAPTDGVAEAEEDGLG